MLSKTVKISHVTNLSDARYCAGMGVEMLGFDIDEASIHYVTPKVFGELSAWIAGVKLVAETSSSDLTSILERIAEYPVDALEITDPAILQNLSSQTTLPLLLRVDADLYGPSDLELMVERYGDMVSHFLLISNEGSTLNDEWMNTFTTLSKEHSLLVGFGLDHEYSVAALTELLPTIGIALRGSEEIRPGFKDFGSMMDILEALEED